MFILDPQFSPIVWITAAVAVISMIYVAFPALNILRRTGLMRFSESADGAHLAASGLPNPKVSVIVYAFSGEDNLAQYLESLMTQDYPDFEVILVYDAGLEATAVIADRFAPLYPSLYITFLPPGSHNLSRRKLAFTMGMKAAKGEIVVTTAANCVIPSPSWLSGMVAPFCENASTEISLGVTRFDFDELRGPRRWYREFDSVMTTSQWIASAMRRRPYRGNGYNLAFKRALFFEQKGYARTINLENGDDDLFINDIANDRNTSVVLTPETLLTMSWGDSANRMWKEFKERYMFTSRWLPRRPFVMAAIASIARWLALLCSAAAIVLALPNLLPAYILGTMLIACAVMEVIAYRNAATALQANRLWVATPVFMLWRPIANAIFRISRYNHRQKNFTWQRRRH